MKNETQEQTVSIDLLRALALRQYHSEDYFLLRGIETRFFEGTEADATEAWGEYLKTLSKDDERLSFYEWVCENLVEVDEMDADADGNYLVLTDEEADEKCKEYCEETAWAFNSDFLEGITGIPAEAFSALSEKCESGNNGVMRIIDKTCGTDEFVKQAISADGRGHFLAGYDGHENEETISLPDDVESIDGNSKETFYIYRIN